MTKPKAKQILNKAKEIIEVLQRIGANRPLLVENLLKRKAQIRLRRFHSQKIDELALDTLVSAVAKTKALRTQNTPSNIAWAHTGLEKQSPKYPLATTKGYSTGQKDNKGNPQYVFDKDNPRDRTALKKSNKLRQELTNFRSERATQKSQENSTLSNKTEMANSLRKYSSDPMRRGAQFDYSRKKQVAKDIIDNSAGGHNHPAPNSQEYQDYVAKTTSYRPIPRILPKI